MDKIVEKEKKAIAIREKQKKEKKKAKFEEVQSFVAHVADLEDERD